MTEFAGEGVVSLVALHRIYGLQSWKNPKLGLEKGAWQLLICEG